MSAIVDVMFAARASSPASSSIGNVKNVPPPASAFWMPAHTATRNRPAKISGISRYFVNAIEAGCTR